MKKAIIVKDYKNLYETSLCLSLDGQRLVRKRNSRINMKDFQGKMAVFDTRDGMPLPRPTLASHCFRYTKLDGYPTVKLYISPQVTMPRDIIRNAGFKIVRNPDDADFTVIHMPKRDRMYPYIRYHCAFWEAQSCSLILAKINLGYQDWTTDSIRDKITAFCEENALELIDLVETTSECTSKAIFIERCQEIADILQDTYPARRYVDVYNLSYNCQLPISVESLRMLENTQANILEKQLLQTDWINYPVTIGVMLSLHHRGIQRIASPAFRTLLTDINWLDVPYDRFLCQYPLEIQPNDWNMLQAYCMNVLTGATEAKPTSVTATDTPSGDLRDLIRTKVYYAPRLITVPMSYSDIMGMYK